MKLLQFIPIKLTMLLVLGILTGYYLDSGIIWPLTFTLLSLTLLGYLFFSNKVTNVYTYGGVTAITTLFLGVLIIGIAQPKNYADHYSKMNTSGTGEWKLKITEVLKSSTFSNRFIAEVVEFNRNEISGKVVLSQVIDSTQKPFQVDDELLVLTKKTKISPPLNPHQFNYKDYLEKQGIYAQLKLNRQNTIVLNHPEKTLLGGAASLRNTISSALRQAGFGEKEFGIIQALFLGQRNDISDATYTAYKNAGAVHILAVSGLHIGILLLFLEFLLRPMELLPKGKNLKLITIVILLWGFALLAGLSASVIRAATMFSFVAYALYLNRPSNTFNILALSMFFILLVINPMLLFHVGFQMSYAAVFAIVWIYPLLQKFWYPKNWLLNKVWQLLSVSIAAQVGVLPINLFYFHQFPGLFFISNLLIIPFLGFILGLGIIVIALVVLDLAPDQLISFYNYIIGLMNKSIDLVAQQEAFIFADIPFDSLQLVLTYTFLIATIWMLNSYSLKRLSITLTCIISLQVWHIYQLHQNQNTEELLIIHQTKNSIVMHRTGTHLTVYTHDSIASKTLVTDYTVGERIAKHTYEPLANVYAIRDKKLIVGDSLGIFPKIIDDLDYIVLTQSPKINLERLLDTINPKVLVADGSNYRSYIQRWETTCRKKNIPFHYTGTKGAFKIKLK